MPTNPDELFQEAACFNCNSNASLADLLKLALLDRISESAGGGGVPGGADGQVQYNDGGTFGGSAGLTFNDATNALTLTGNLTIGQSITSTVAGTLSINPPGGQAVQVSATLAITGSCFFAANGRHYAWRNQTLRMFDTDADTILLSTDNTVANARDLELRNIITNNTNAALSTNTALTDNAGGGAGTLTNAPSAGDPTKWIAIDDNGTPRFIPTWT